MVAELEIATRTGRVPRLRKGEEDAGFPAEAENYGSKVNGSIARTRRRRCFLKL